METVLLAVTVVSLIVALVMSVTAARLAREERGRAAARVAALSAAAGVAPAQFVSIDEVPRQAPWATAPVATAPKFVAEPPVPDLALGDGPSLQQGFLNGSATTRSDASPQRALGLVAAVLFVGVLGGLVWTISEGRATTHASAATVATDNPLELVSLRHDRQASKLAVSGLVRNPVAGKPVERLSAVVFLFDQQGSFIASAKAPVDFVKLAAGDESPFVVSLDAPASVARYRVSFRTDEGIVPHIDRRGAPPIDSPEQPVSVTLTK
jgi:hypothetical protein